MPIRKLYIALIFAGLLSGMAGAYVIRNWDPYRDIPKVTISRLNESESDWYAEGILNYRAVVAVHFSSERRRYEIVVSEGLLEQARSSRWNRDNEIWERFRETSAEEAQYFTMKGLFAMLRAALLNEDVRREVLRMETDDRLAFPRRIVLGRIFEDGLPVDDTDVLIEVIEFESR